MNDSVCADCGNEQEGMTPCTKCKSRRVILISIAEMEFGENWRDAFKEPKPDDSVKLRMKVWTDDEGGRWLIASIMATPMSLALGKPFKASAMRDAAVKTIELTAEQYNALPYSVFVETERNVKSPGVRNAEVVDL